CSRSSPAPSAFCTATGTSRSTRSRTGRRSSRRTTSGTPSATRPSPGRCARGSAPSTCTSSAPPRSRRSHGRLDRSRDLVDDRRCRQNRVDQRRALTQRQEALLEVALDAPCARTPEVLLRLTGIVGDLVLPTEPSLDEGVPERPRWFPRARPRHQRRALAGI